MKLFVVIISATLLCNSASAQNTSTLERDLQNPERPSGDKARDATRNAPAILEFMGIDEGDTALDVISMGGWYSEVLSYAVGRNGKVYMHNNPIPITEGSTDERAERMGRLSNVENYVGAISDIPSNSIDFAITALNFHDVYNRSRADADAILRSILVTLKPGGILALIDHEGTEGADNPTLHRIAFEDAVKASLAAGFVLIGTTDLLENPEDNHTLPPFDPSLDRNTDRFVLKLAKPR